MDKSAIEWLVTMRAETPEFIARGSVFTKHCRRCLARLVNAPSGIRFLRENPSARPLCLVCYQYNPPGRFKMAGFAATPEELERELTDTIPNPWRTRN
jgi:hypothetical protein